ncbi:hypothetical protein [Litchfieldella rifensis]|uniref:Uncharacterized protein n=1 Tax=Litchfieldella rifensis TaxID=762643 RepID=A0ABV7LKR3_9GAMM
MATVGLGYAEFEKRYGACDCLPVGESALSNANLRLGPAFVERSMKGRRGGQAPWWVP